MKLTKEVMERLALPDLAVVEEKFQQEQQEQHAKIVVLDDDPTGVQTVHDIYVYTDWETKSLEDGFRKPEKMFFILTNSRSFSAEETAMVHRTIAQRTAETARKTKQEFLMISRGDSTLRGHFPLETETLKETLEQELKITYDGEIICPIFPEGGRYTYGDVHYVQDGEEFVPAGETEFAKDKTFGYHSSDLKEYVEEKTAGAYRAEDCISFSVEELRSLDYEGMTEKLASVRGFQKIIVNALDYADIKIFATVLFRAMKKGNHYLIRSAAAVTKVLGNVSDAPLLSKDQVRVPGNTNGGLIVIGSHVKKTCDQLDCLKTSQKALRFEEFHAEACFEEESMEAEICRMTQFCQQEMLAGKTAVIYTSRKLVDTTNRNKEEILAVSVNISNALTSIVSRLAVEPGFILAKGGITSSDVGTKGLGVKKALVLGQIKKGIPVWKTGAESKFPGIPYIIFPGNVGTAETLKEIAEELI